MNLEFHQLDLRLEHLRVRHPARERRLLASLAAAGQQIPIVVVAVGTFLFATVGPRLGHQPLIIRGGSMTPAITLGSLVDVSNVDPSALRAGDIVSVKAPNGTIDTHRINRVVSLPGGLYIETKGDANKTPDPVLVPVSAVLGRVDFRLPALGYVMYMLTIPTGVASIFCLALTLLLAIWLLEDVEDEDLGGLGGGGPEPYESDLARSLWAARVRELAG